MKVSYVTNIILTCGPSEEDGEDVFPAIDEVNAWLLDNGQHSGLTHLNGHEGGGKAWECDVFGGAFNYLHIDEFAKAVAGARWTRPDQVQLFISGQEEDVFGLVNLVDPMKSKLSSEETRKARKALGRGDVDEEWY